MFNFFHNCYFCILLASSLQICSFNYVIAEDKPFEFNVDAENFESLTTMQKIDCFIDLGMEIERSTGEKFKYKELLKKTYSYLEEKGVNLPKKVKKDMKKIVGDRIAERFFSKKLISKAYNEDGSFKNETLDRFKKEEPESDDSLRGSVASIGVGVGLILTRDKVATAVGLFMITREIGNIYDHTKGYFSSWWDSGNTRDQNSRDRDQNNHKDNNKRSLSRD